MPRVALGDLVTKGRVKRTAPAESVWHLNLDQIESGTGRVLSKLRSSDGEAGNSTQFFEKGTVLYSKLRPYLNKVVVADECGFATTELVPLRVRTDIAVPEYLAHYLRSNDFLSQATNRVTGAKMPRLILDWFWNHEVPLPSLEEQRRIADLLDEADRLQRLRKEANEKAQRILPALFLDMFGDPETNPLGWERKSLSGLCEVSGGATPSTKEAAFWNGEIAWATPKDLSRKWDFVLPDTERHITKAGMGGCATRLMPKGAVLLSCRAPIGLSAIAGREMCANQGFKVLTCGRELNPWYLLAWLRLSKDYLQSLGRGATFKEISTKIVREIEIPVPPKERQDTFAATMGELRTILLAQDSSSETVARSAAILRSRLFAEAM